MAGLDIVLYTLIGCFFSIFVLESVIRKDVFMICTVTAFDFLLSQAMPLVYWVIFNLGVIFGSSVFLIFCEKWYIRTRYNMEHN